MVKCTAHKCKKRAVFGLGQTKPIRCRKHKLENMIDVVHKKCEFIGCKKRPCYGVEGTKIAKFCVKHKLENMIDIISKTCEFLGCKIRPTFNVEGSKRGRFCTSHKLDNMIDVKNKICEFLGCKMRSYYGIEGTKTAQFCEIHKLDNMINIHNKTCEAQGCKKHRFFNIEGSKSGRFCKKHKLDGMINILKKTCESLGCKICPIYGVKGSKLAQFCEKHKLENMVNVKHKTCEITNCNIRAKFNTKNSKTGRFCANHKLENMIDIYAKTCEFLDCKIQPIFNIKGSKKGRFCDKHKLENMVNIKDKICRYLDCESQSSFGQLFGTKTHCAKHKKANEYRKFNPKCLTQKCKNQPFYSNDNYPKRCEEHKLPEDSNIVEKPCKNCGICQFIANSGDTCTYCLDYKNDKIRKAKEIRIKDLLDANKIQYEAHDKIVEMGCSKYRPDFIIDCGTTKIVLEVDENQHSSYPCECEQIRMIQIFQDFGGSRLLFIRYNPDAYIDEKGHKNSIPGKQREKILLETISGIKNRIKMGEELNSMLSVIYIAYDGWDGRINTQPLDYENVKNKVL